jgi:hypothetical protein
MHRPATPRGNLLCFFGRSDESRHVVARADERIEHY